MTASLPDPQNVNMGTCDMGMNIAMNVVDFLLKANASLLLQKPLGWWRANAQNIPLLQEIREVVKKAEEELAGTRRQGQSVVFVQVRMKTILVDIEKWRVLLAVSSRQGSSEDDIGTLEWFLGEIQQDVNKLKDDGNSQTKDEPETETEEMAIKVGLEHLSALPTVQSAIWQPSTRTIKVILKDNTNKDFTAPMCKKRKADAMDGDAQAIKNSLAEALDWAQLLHV